MVTAVPPGEYPTLTKTTVTGATQIRMGDNPQSDRGFPRNRDGHNSRGGPLLGQRAVVFAPNRPMLARSPQLSVQRRLVQW